MKNRNVIISAVLTIVMCVSMISGATFALFTSEDTVNIAVSSGTVKMTASVANIKTTSLDDAPDFEGRDDGTFTQGGSASFDAETATLTVDRILPGDKVTLQLVGTNESNVNVLYRYRVACVDGTKLMQGLVVTINGEEYTSIHSYRSAWATLTNGADMDAVNISIELPEDAGNEYQSLNTKIALTVEAIQGNADGSAEEEIIFWDGTADTSWYDEDKTTFSLVTEEEFAGLMELVDAGETFENKTVKLESDVDLKAYDANGELLCFDPIGSYRNDQAFKGTFDGNGKTIKNLTQNTWALDNGYYYSDCGLGLFGAVEDAHIKNLTVDGANISGESAICGIIAGVSGGETIFENITVTNSKGADYQYYSGGIVGWASGKQQFIGCTVGSTVAVAAQWGDFDNSTGGVIGGCSASSEIYMKDCNVSCRIDAYNDVTSSYQWYAYRRCGMLIGNTNSTEKVDGRTVAAAPQLVCENVTVTYGEWADYTYCEFAGTSWPYVRVQEGTSASAYSNPRYGVATDAEGNKVVDDNHVHNDGEAHNELIVFDQLYGGGQGVYGGAEHEGVKVIYNNPSKQVSSETNQ